MLKRRFPPKLDRVGKPPKPLQTKNYIYDVVENTDTKTEPDIKVILTSFVEGVFFALPIIFTLLTFAYLKSLKKMFLGVGLKNDVITVRPNFGRNKLLLPGLAVYASPENLKKLKEELANTNSQENADALIVHSSRFAELVF